MSVKKMKHILFVLFSIISFVSFSQVQNGSFENSSAADLSNWKWTCGSVSFKGSPPGGGDWCIKVSGGNYQSCFPGYAYQKLPSVANGQTYILSGWAFTQTSPTVGIYFGTKHNGLISLQAGSTTTSTTWTHLSVQSDFTLIAGDTAVVVLFGGNTGGPAQGYGYFDLIDLQLITGSRPFEQKHPIWISPNPFSSETTVRSDIVFEDATFTILNLFGQMVLKREKISGQTINLNRGNLPGGIYILQLTQDNKTISTDKLIITDN